VDPHGSFNEFVKKDPVKNIDVHRNYSSVSADFGQYRTKWAVGTTKYTFNKVNNDGMLDRTKI
jgi:hypothetical protein